ncbi:hypothetical protein GUJ93_ZPchr0002g23005 [Zizania palustris]|uniref:Uncharacterized protein n=1 Tax=Zizania palustris TaxID=103762 RepID=A0A8J5RTZ3_ZIZPA|nr:hypothetical protein GUJ93_ZPchr0002g23005 [Zizania palustris]
MILTIRILLNVSTMGPDSIVVQSEMNDFSRLIGVLNYAITQVFCGLLSSMTATLVADSPCAIATNLEALIRLVGAASAYLHDQDRNIHVRLKKSPHRSGRNNAQICAPLPRSPPPPPPAPPLAPCSPARPPAPPPPAGPCAPAVGRPAPSPVAPRPPARAPPTAAGPSSAHGRRPELRPRPPAPAPPTAAGPL